jgi:hypothetical protein
MCQFCFCFFSYYLLLCSDKSAFKKKIQNFPLIDRLSVHLVSQAYEIEDEKVSNYVYFSELSIRISLHPEVTQPVLAKVCFCSHKELAP